MLFHPGGRGARERWLRKQGQENFPRSAAKPTIDGLILTEGEAMPA
jgi:hypothetical protein